MKKQFVAFLIILFLLFVSAAYVEDTSELISYRKGDKWGFCNRIKEIIIPTKYDLIFSFCEGLAPVKMNNKWSFIDKSGQEVIPFKYDRVNPFSEGLASVRLNGKWGFIDRNGIEYWED